MEPLAINFVIPLWGMWNLQRHPTKSVEIVYNENYNVVRRKIDD